MKIDYSEYDCMCWEKDEFGHTLCCDPPECKINFCPVKKLLRTVRVVRRYCLNTIETTNDFPNWLGPIRDEMKQILKLIGSEFIEYSEDGEEK